MKPEPDDIAIDRLTRRSTEIARVLKALASERRLKLLCVLAYRETRATELAKHIGCSQSGTSQHLSWLRNENLVRIRCDGQRVYYSLSDSTRDLLLKLLSLSRE